MHVASKRILSMLTAILAALALAASPALAGEDDDEGDGDESAPITSSGSDSGSVVSGAPVGGVDTGAGGMAEQAPDAVLLGLASGALMLVATGGGLVAVSRQGS
jgi:hypothetical protein